MEQYACKIIFRKLLPIIYSSSFFNSFLLSFYYLLLTLQLCYYIHSAWDCFTDHGGFVFLLQYFFSLCFMDYFLLSSKIINKKIYNRNRKVLFEPNWGLKPGRQLSDNSEELLWRNVVFSTGLYLVRTKNIKQVRDTMFKVSKQNKTTTTTKTYTQVSMALAPGRDSYHWRSTGIGVPGRETFNLYF